MIYISCICAADFGTPDVLKCVVSCIGFSIEDYQNIISSSKRRRKCDKTMPEIN
jgi:hypothetical protein